MKLQLFFLVCLGLGYGAGRGVRMCYWQSWSGGRASPGDFNMQDFDGTLCTHMIFAFAGVAEDGAIINTVDPRFYWELLDWRNKFFPDVKVLLAVGGWNEGATKFSIVANDTQKRISFADSAVRFCKQYGFDGIDMDWEYPADERFDAPGEPYDKANFPKLLNALNTALEQAEAEMGKEYLLTAAVGCGPDKIDKSYSVRSMNAYLDYFHLMAYDLRMFGTWSDAAQRIGHHAPLRRSSREGPAVDGLNIEEIIDNFIAAGASPEKLVLGVGTYGKTYTMKSRAEHNYWDIADGHGVMEPFLATEGTISYTGICYQIPLSTSPFEIHFDEETQVPYALNDTLWIGYDNPESTEKKVDLAYEKGLGGMMVWSIDMDDCKNLCQDWFKCPIMQAIKDRMEYHTEKGGWPKTLISLVDLTMVKLTIG